MTVVQSSCGDQGAVRGIERFLILDAGRQFIPLLSSSTCLVGPASRTGKALAARVQQHHTFHNVRHDRRFRHCRLGGGLFWGGVGGLWGLLYWGVCGGFGTRYRD
jgi:hypothetical protein